MIPGNSRWPWTFRVFFHEAKLTVGVDLDALTAVWFKGDACEIVVEPAAAADLLI